MLTAADVAKTRAIMMALKQFDSFCGEVGMTMTTAFCVFAKTVVRRHNILQIIALFSGMR